MSSITIQPVRLTSLVALNRMFVDAVENHFDYFPPDVRHRVAREHRLHRLLRAALDRHRVVLTAHSGKQLVGYAIGAAPAVGPAQLYWLFVAPGYRGANIGLSLMSRMLKDLGRRGAATVSIATHDHRRYYERQGFKFVKKTMVDGVAMDVLSFRVSS